MKVHAALGNGFTHVYCLFLKGIRECFAFQEVIYKRALAIEMRYSNLSFEREHNMKIHYRDEEIGERRVDFFVEIKIMVGLKAIIQLEDVHLAQTKNNLEAYNLEIGLLINFGSTSLQFKRLINQKYHSNFPVNPQII